MFNLLDILKHEMVGKTFALRSIGKGKARFLHYDLGTAQDVIAVLYFDEDIDTEHIHGAMYFSELVAHHENGSNCRLRCEVRQL